MENALLSAADADRYGGQYVAVRSLERAEVVASGREADQVLEEAVRKGIESPILIFVPSKDVVCIY